MGYGTIMTPIIAEDVVVFDCVAIAGPDRHDWIQSCRCCRCCCCCSGLRHRP